MKKNLSSLVIFVLLLFIFVNKVDASLTCSGPNKITARETSQADPAKFNAYMPLCQMTYSHKEPITDGPGAAGVDASDLSRVSRTGEAWTTAYQASVDGKATYPVSVQVCNDPKATLDATMTCSYIEIWNSIEKCLEEETYTYKYLNPTCFKQCQADQNYIFEQSGLVEKPNVEQMKAIVRNCDVECTETRTGTKCKEGMYEEHWCGGSASGGTYMDWFGTGESKCGRTSETTVSVSDLPLTTPGFSVGEAKKLCESKFGYRTTCACFEETTVYTFQCPVYKCTKVKSLVDICTASFKDNKGNDLYCVNPGQVFSATVSETESYVKDTEFNVRNCETSYSTVDCGYANILIEGQKYGISSKAIELALRLWGVHTQQAGFDRTGVSNRINSSCSRGAFFMRGDSNEVVNPYVKTYNEFRETLLGSLRNRGEINPVSDVSLLNITCDEDKLGVACGGSAEYKQALALLANTILGNNKMQDHLSDLFEGEINEDINSVNLITDEDGDQYVEIHFNEIKKITQDRNVKINCKNLNKMVQESKITEKQKKQIEPYCKVEAVFVDGRGREIGRLGGGTPEYCYKDYCRIKVSNFAMCDIENEEVTPIKIKVTHAKSYSSDSVNRYVSCSNPNNSQLLYGFDEDLQENLPKNAANGDPLVNTEKTSETFVISNYRCAGRCDDYSLRGEVKDKCSDDLSNYNGTFESNIKDPSLKCIVNMGRPEYKSMYDYSEYFGVNTNICRIYCSDEVTYKIADKIIATSGRYFYYDIQSNADANKNIRYMFTNIVEEKRTCVSEIYYSNDFAEDINWKKIYNLGSGNDGITENEINGIKNWTSLFHVMVKKALREGGREENVNKLLYDLMNCNLYSEEEILATGVKKPTNYQYGSVREKILDKFSESNKYGLAPDDSCTVNRNTNECVKMNNITYDFGASPDGKSVSMKSVATVSDTFDNMVYCSGYGCFAYDPDHKEAEYDYPTNTTRAESEISIVSTNGAFMNLYGKHTIKIPTNDYVMFSIKADVSFYNNSKYETKPSGDVIRSGSNTSRDTYMKLPSYSFPIDKNAYTLNTCVSKPMLGETLHRCTINQTFDKVKTFFRRNIDDEFATKVKLTNKFSCYVDVQKPSTAREVPISNGSLRDATIYRNVDVSNLFPSSTDGYTTNTDSNWATVNGKQATNAITNSAANLKTTDDYLDYSITLSPTQIKNIKEYNKQNDGYINEAELSCQVVDDTYQKCISPFMTELRNSTEYGTMDLEHNGLN